ncbi:unnamed protein product [Moneuplotes crassus]|uniref:Ubiquitin-like domain-containing protein n=1 Tax=Euplotes crassus TaxID=5936 RepID=A0AAD2D9X6_EUPCR|nr:unnamed protein product [Moneuplotes crassus]
MGKIQIFVKTNKGKNFNIQLEGTETIGQIKSLIEKKEGTTVENQMLIFRGKSLVDDSLTVKDVGIQKNNQLKLVTKLLGGF